ncbi:uncharacterized protein JN550_008383 [Neoarthrinium moseri]|uniref:uncharacterized protein n=1 Tax=Neoarthrinium moseri TaxID=1658444 RepID=UPI001FDD61B4|nr:uncharacterized protein JN550_008383 [Neoarthrinium moseri]KAI1865335.1 hypothetical protein JN550_008383 [Neoarthrinium moseri]
MNSSSSPGNPSPSPGQPRTRLGAQPSSPTNYSSSEEDGGCQSQTPEEQSPAALVIGQIEDILEDAADALTENRPMTIPLRNRRSGNEVPVSFPTPAGTGARRFTAVLHILYICHEALVTGNIVTKRNIYYHNPGLFGSQAYVDYLVDDIAFTFGVSRDHLNIVAASKGLIAGGQFSHGDGHHATFRSLAAASYFNSSSAGPGLLVTAKGYPDLATRQFLSLLHSAYAYIPMYALVDFDPDGIGIMRTFKLGSRNLDHEVNATVPSLSWLGVKSEDIFSVARPLDSPSKSSSQPSTCTIQSQSPAGAVAPAQITTSHDSLSPENPATPSTTLAITDYKMVALTLNDRNKAINLLAALKTPEDQDAEDMNLTSELQLMLMLNTKFEIQAVEDMGNMTNWLDARLKSSFDGDLE